LQTTLAADAHPAEGQFFKWGADIERIKIFDIPQLGTICLVEKKTFSAIAPIKSKNRVCFSLRVTHELLY
jgi:hypothetical protein